MRDTRQFLEALGIKLGRYAEGSHKALCPKCSARRSRVNQNEPCLYVKITSEGCGYHCFNCGWAGGTNARMRIQRPSEKLETRIHTSSSDRNHEAALRIWGESKIGSLPYLAERGITISTPLTLRRHGALLHKASGLYLCGMIAAVQAPRREIIAIHRTYLTTDWKRKAPVSDNKMALGGLGTGAVRLAAAGVEIGLCEGIETGLSAMELFGIPLWCALGSERLHKVELPPEVKKVTIFADNGEAGRKAAMRAVETYTRQRRKVVLRFPPEQFSDFNDVLMADQVAA
jgi:hypothetical protein